MLIRGAFACFSFYRLAVFGLYYFESNTHCATILGIVGAGGIGLQLSDRNGVPAWDQASLIIMMILFTVYLIDSLSNHVRQRFLTAPDLHS